MRGFKNVTAYVEGRGLVKTDLVFDEKILCIGKSQNYTQIKLPDDAIVLPGFIDEHIHGAGGADAMDGSCEAIAVIANTLAAEGTTGFLATTMTQSPQAITAALSAVREYMSGSYKSGAAVLGVHLEGPFISAKHKGAQPLEYVAKPNIKTFDGYNAASGGAIKIVTYAPEEDENFEFTKHLRACGIIPSIGHTGAKTADIAAAMNAGAMNITHTYNAQSPLHHREIGTVGSALLYNELNCELICDTIHVSVEAMKLLVKNKPSGKLTLITDAMRAKGIADGVSELGGQTVYVKGGEARLADGTLAGSVLTMNRAIQNLTQKVGVPFVTAVDCATAVPAKTLGIYDKTGSIALGKSADFAVIDRDYNVILTVRGGVTVYER